MSRRLAIASLVLGLALVGCGGGKGKGKTASTQRAATTAASAPPECQKVPAPKPKPAQTLPKPTLRLDPAHTYRAVMDTSCGSFTITLDVRHSPRTAASFAYLAQRGFYDNLVFHRVISGFVIQGGDPKGDGTGGPGYKVVEAPPKSTRYTRGVVAMAKTEIEDPGTSGSQFYVVTGEDAQLPPDYALLGRVTAGMDVVDAIGVVPTNRTDPDKQDRPLQPVVIRHVAVQ